MSNEIPGSLKAWAIIDIILGAIGAIMGIVALGALGVISKFGGSVFLGFIKVLLYLGGSALMIVTGIGLLGTKAWSKMIGTIMCGVGLLWSLYSIITAITTFARVNKVVSSLSSRFGSYGAHAGSFARGASSIGLIISILFTLGMAAYFVFHYLSIKKNEDKLTS